MSCGLKLVPIASTSPARYGLRPSARRQHAMTVSSTTSAGCPYCSEYRTGYHAMAPMSHTAFSRPPPGAPNHQAATSAAIDRAVHA